MSYTIEQVRRTTEFAKATLEAGNYVFRVAKVLKKTADRGFNSGKEVLVFISNPLTDPTNASSYDGSRTLFSEVAIPVFVDGATDEQFKESQKQLRSFGYWAQVLSIVPPAPEKTGDKQADWAAYEAWCVDAANALLEADCTGRCFRGEITVNEKGYPKLANKSAV